MDIQRSRDQNVQRGRPLFHFSFFLSSPPPPPPSGPCFTRVTASSRGFPRVQKQPSYYYRVRTDCSRVIRVAVCLLRHVASLSSLMKHRKAALFLKARPFADPRIFIPLLVDHILPIIIPIPFFLNSCNTIGDFDNFSRYSQGMCYNRTKFLKYEMERQYPRESIDTRVNRNRTDEYTDERYSNRVSTFRWVIRGWESGTKRRTCCLSDDES